MRRLCIYAHYDARGLVRRFTTHYLERLAEECTRVDFVSTAPLSSAELQKAEHSCGRVITKENRGYDFGMWKHALESTDFGAWDELVLTNSSVFGPLFPLGPIFDRMAELPCDFWGATDNYEIAWHLQSYFLVFKKKALTSPAFEGFWRGVLPYQNKDQVIRSYEVGLTMILREAGLVGEPFVAARSLFPDWPLNWFWRYKRRNPTCYHPVRLIRRGMPFVKMELLRDNPGSVRLGPVYRAIAETGFDCSLIELDERPRPDWRHRLDTLLERNLLDR